MKLIETLKTLNAFQFQYRPIAVLVWLSSAMFSVLLSILFDDLWIPVFVTFAIVYLWLDKLFRYEVALSKRIEANDAVPIWHVVVNGVTVGALSDSAYAEILRNVCFNTRIYISQILNVGKIVLHAFNTLFVNIPLYVFWGGVVLLLADPDTFTSVLAELQMVTLTQVASSQSILQILVIVCLILVAAELIIGIQFGYVNKFDLDINEKVRQSIDCPVNGDIFLYRYAGGARAAPVSSGTVPARVA